MKKAIQIFRRISGACPYFHTLIRWLPVYIAAQWSFLQEVLGADRLKQAFKLPMFCGQQNPATMSNLNLKQIDGRTPNGLSSQSIRFISLWTVFGDRRHCPGPHPGVISLVGKAGKWIQELLVKLVGINQTWSLPGFNVYPVAVPVVYTTVRLQSTSKNLSERPKPALSSGWLPLTLCSDARRAHTMRFFQLPQVPPGTLHGGLRVVVPRQFCLLSRSTHKGTQDIKIAQAQTQPSSQSFTPPQAGSSWNMDSPKASKFIITDMGFSKKDGLEDKTKNNLGMPNYDLRSDTHQRSRFRRQEFCHHRRTWQCMDENEIICPSSKCLQEDVKLKSHSTIPQQYQQEKVPLFSTLPEAPMQLLQVQTSTA
ncbi:hypothetical protein PABG_11743 [Paracoccidioides brasiliensis Pb03]|nr:hypothetical protein PABG_11743 [Paracoccidioides brasiliensis Pb03]